MVLPLLLASPESDYLSVLPGEIPAQVLSAAATKDTSVKAYTFRSSSNLILGSHSIASLFSRIFTTP